MALRLIIADDDGLARALIEAIVERDRDLELVGSAERSPDTKIVLSAPDASRASVAMAPAVVLAKGSPRHELLRAIRAAVSGNG